MKERKIGSLFTGYGGLDLAVQEVFGGTIAWVSEIKKSACKVIEANHPGVPNLGDVTKVDWGSVEKVDVITGGYPCQPFSRAGKRMGKNDERHLWPYVKDAIGTLGPRIVVLENVSTHVSIGLADVIGDLSSLGYDSRWGVIRASDAGAPHQRARVFILAHPNGAGWEKRSGKVADDKEHDPAKRHSPHVGRTAWGKYQNAISRWEQSTRPAPRPTIRLDGVTRLNPCFVEWMMGLPDGHVTSHGLSASQALEMLGNGVVPQQASLALRLLTREE